MTIPDHFPSRFDRINQLDPDQALVDATHDVLNAQVAFKSILDRIALEHGRDAGELCSLFHDAFDDLGLVLRGQPFVDRDYRQMKPGIAEWDEKEASWWAEKRERDAVREAGWVERVNNGKKDLGR